MFSTLLLYFCHKKQEKTEGELKLCDCVYNQGTYSAFTAVNHFATIRATNYLHILIICICFSYPLQSSFCFGTESFILTHPQTTVTLTGFTRPRTLMTITSEVAGRCLFVSGDIGDHIDGSRPFIKIDPTFILLDIETNKLAQEQLKRKITLNKQELERYKKLLVNQSIPQTKLDQVSLQYDLSIIQLKSLINTEKRLQELYKRHVITGPPEYRIIDKTVEPGELINVGQNLAGLGDF